MLEPVNPKQDFIELEHRILEFWRTAAIFGDAPTGHCVAEDYRFAPMVRMGTIMILPDPATDFAITGR